MKKINITLFVFLLMISIFVPFSFATEDATPIEGQENNTENIEEIVSDGSIITNTYGKVIETNGIKEVVNGEVIDQVQEVVIEITKGDYINEEFTTEYVLSYDLKGTKLVPELSVGDKVEVQLTETSDGKVSIIILDVSRTSHIIFAFVILLISIIVVSGKKGIRAILGLLFTILIIRFFMLKRLFAGANVTFTSVITSVIVIFGTLVIIDGFNKKTIGAFLGIFGGTILSGIFANIFIGASKLAGGYEDAIALNVNFDIVRFSLTEILVSGVMISSIGACMDIGLSIAKELDSIKMKDSEVTWQELFKKGMDVGKEIIGTMTNTLILAILGNGVTLLLLLMSCDLEFAEIVNKERVAEQVILAIVGSIGVVYTVPITSIAYSLLNRHKIIYKRSTESKVDGKRSLKL